VRAYKTELDLNNRQRTICFRHAGAARWAYNWGLQQKVAAYEAGEKSPTAIDLHRKLNALKKTEVPWMYSVSKCAPQEALRNLDRAFTNFFRRCKQGAKKKGFPRFKSRKQGIGSFTLTGAFAVTERSIRLPRLGWLRLKEAGYIPSDKRILSVTVSERARRWFVSVRTDEDEPIMKPGTETIGVDVGVKNLATLSNGMVFGNPKALKASERRLRQLQKAVSRKPRGSSNRRKAVARLARQHYRVACIRSDSLHKATTMTTKLASTLAIESLNVAGMMKNHFLAKSLSDASLSEFHRQIEYKAKWTGARLVKADRFFPSSKTCSECGLVREHLTLSERVFKCECGFEADRDLNAAINLRNLAVSSTVAACCQASTGRNRMVSAKLAHGQEPNTIQGVGLNG